ncbi:MAG TPA: SpoIIE family protein phosphatase, partial [Gemmatimonadales bacterium]|nr:SpoIIE family protein phosphatase [Gemmatimonadales bacterium]
MTRLERLLPVLAALSGTTLRLWRARTPGGRLLPVGGGLGEGREEPIWTPTPNGGGRVDTPDGPAWFQPIPSVRDAWLEVRGGGAGAGAGAEAGAVELAEVIGAVMGAEEETDQVAAELSGRYEEIDLIYTISEILGHTIRLDEAANRILREVSAVVRARRATLMVHDPRANVLRLVAARGVELGEVDPVEVDDPRSIAARVFREMRIISYDPTDQRAQKPASPVERQYRGQAFLSVPVVYASPGRVPTPIGVINLTDRTGEDAFTAGDRKLVAAIANQIGAAIENARLVERDLGQQRVRRELELAHDLQLKLLPSPAVIATKADVAARCRPAESVGGDFYNLLSLHGERVGVMIGDVSSHGFSAALIMALAMAASGIHAETAESPHEALRRLETSLSEELTETEMFLTLCYAVADPAQGTLTYANAGHPHAFLVATDTGAVTRLDATRPPLGLGDGGTGATVAEIRDLLG